MTPIEPFRVDVPESQLVDLRERLARTRWPEESPTGDWSQGIPLSYVQELCTYWAESYDWRKTEARLNELEHFRTEIDGLDIHFVHVRSPHAEARPLLITHGWPGSIIEFLDVIGPLTDPPDPKDAFHLVLPSLPGYGFSGRPGAPGWTVGRIADAWVELMARLGYQRFGAQGGDWGASVTVHLALQHPDRLTGIHLNMVVVPPDPETMDDLTEAEQACLATIAAFQAEQQGYAEQQSTRPQTIGYGLVDSPAALAAWIVDKIWALTDHDGDPRTALSFDEMLDNLMLYWLPATGASSARLYWERKHNFTGGVTNVPTGAAIFAKEVFRPSRRWAAKQFTDIVHWTEIPEGGHFAAWEKPELFVEDVRRFFRLLG